ncbi:MAG: hypothetical protein RLZ42_680, partial [Armatimonadota bacterium]
MTQAGLEVLKRYCYHGANGDGVDGIPWDKSCA